MSLTAIAIGWCLLAQPTADPYKPQLSPRKAPPATIHAADAPTDDRLGPRGSVDDPPSRYNDRAPVDDIETRPHASLPDHESRAKLQPPDLLAEALEKPDEAALEGKPLSLATALSHASDRSQQLKIAQAYWRLSAAQADYHWERNARDQLSHFTRHRTNQPETLGARATARADVLDAELAVTIAQQDLADLMSTASEPELPLASDRPHVGGYDTHYDTIFTGRAPPPRVRLIHRTLPVQRKAIDLHGAAIVAAIDALAATGEEFQNDQASLTTLLRALDQLKHERRAFIGAVRGYNQNIAEYLFAVAPSSANYQTLASKLILKSERGAAPAQDRSLRRSIAPETDTEPADPREPGNNPPADVQEQTSQYGPREPEGRAEETGVYEGIRNVKPPVRVQKLAGLLHWDRVLPADAGRPTSLADCLRGVATEARLPVIVAYWRSRESAAQYQAANDKWDQLDNLSAAAIGRRDEPGAAELGVRLHAARLAARAAVYDAHVAFAGAEFALTQAAGRRLEEPWLLPETPPQSGRYNVSQAARTRRWAELVKLEHAKLEDRADAVIQADNNRAQLVNETRHSTNSTADSPTGETVASLDQVITAITRQHKETVAFLQDLTAYNIAIARHALADRPASISSDELVKWLVIPRTAKGES